MNLLTICAPLLVVLLSCPVTRAASAHQQCEADGDCPDGSFCELNKICETCVPCQKLFNRQPSGLSSCARSEDDCGTCLPGYQAEDHTVQRRSFKCYPIDDRDGSDLQLTDRSGILWTSVTAVAATIVVLATLLLAFATYYFRRQPTPPREENSKLIKDTSGNNDRLPPPYDQIGLSRTSDGYTIVSVHEESLNEATPFGRPFFPEAEPDVHNQPDNHLNIGEPQQDSSSMAGSTETIPSLWEPRDDDPPNGSTQGLGRARPAGRLVRSLSLGSLPAVRPASVPATRSCSDLSDGIYRHRHIRLSNYRRSGLPESKIDLYEPLPPQSFVFRDPGTQQGSQDSGFFQDVPSSSSNSTARRRPAANDVEIQFAIALFAKRRRQD